MLTKLNEKFDSSPAPPLSVARDGLMELDAFDAFMDFLLYVFAFSILASGTVLGLGIIRARIRR